MIWAAIGVVFLVVAFVVAWRLLARTTNDVNPTIAGALVLKRPQDVLASPPSIVYIGNIYKPSAAIGIQLTSGPQPATLRIVIANIKPDGCVPGEGVTITSPPQKIGPDTGLYSFHQGYPRTAYMFDVAIPAQKTVSVSCDVTDLPERETYVTRRIAFEPPQNQDTMAAAMSGGFVPVYPLMVSIQRVTESTGFATSGGKRVHDNTIGAVLESSYLTQNDPILRAFWSDERARTRQTFWLFTMAALAGVGFAAILEAARPLIERLRP
jgi:hypothetical protein